MRAWGIGATLVGGFNKKRGFAVGQYGEFTRGPRRSVRLPVALRLGSLTPLTLPARLAPVPAPVAIVFVLLALALSAADASAAALSAGATPDRVLDRAQPAAAVTEIGESAGARVPGELVVRFAPSADAAERADARTGADVTRKRSLLLDRTQLVRVEDGTARAAARALERLPAVLYAEPNFIYRAAASPPNDPRFGELWGLENSGQLVNGVSGTPGKDIDALAGWDTTRGAGTVIAIADSGVAEHPDLSPNFWVNSGELPGNSVDDDANGFADDVRGWDFVDADANPDDLNSHGTHVAGTVAAQDEDALGVAGAAPDARIMAVRVLDEYGSGSLAGIADGIVYAAENGADVVNLSLGGSNFSQAMSDALHVARSNGTVAAVAAGNDGTDDDLLPSYPCAYKHSNVICVAAIDQNGALASFSNYGDVAVDVGAPGTNILSTVPYEPVWTEDFETPLAGRWETGGTENTWALGTARSVSPSHSLEDSPGGEYAMAVDSFVRNADANTIDLTGETGCRLEYMLDLDVESGLNGDSFYVIVEGTGGPQTVAIWAGDTLNQFYNLSHDISAFDGDASVRVRFRLLGDGDFNAGDGAYIDDVSILCRASTYEFLDGTSMATPHVAAIAALVRAAAPSSSPAQVVEAIRDGAVAEPSLAGKTVSGGRAVADGAIAALDPGLPDPDPPAHETGLADSPWPMFQHDAQHTGRSPYNGPSKLALDWSFATEGTPGSPAIGEDGTIYLPVGLANTDYRGYLYAINPDGTQRWRYEFPTPPGDSSGTIQAPGFTTPAVDADGTIYVHTNAGATAPGPSVMAGPTYLYAINPDGTTKWIYEVGLGFTGSTISSPAIAPDGTIYLASKNTGFFAIDPDGLTKWVDVPTHSSITTTAAVGPDGTAYIESVYAYNPDGTVKWVAPLPGSSGDGSPSVAGDGTVYSCTAGATDQCNALSPVDGSTLWTFPLPDMPYGTTPAIAADGTIHFTVDNVGLYAVYPGGTERWTFDPGLFLSGPERSPIVGADGRTYVTDDPDNRFFVVNQDGTENHRITASLKAGTGDELSPAIGADGTLYLPETAALRAYVDDSTPPPPPMLTDTDPDSPANNNSPRVKGDAEAGSTVKIYSTPDCSGSPLATGTAANFSSPGLMVSVAGDTTTTFRATATDAVGNTSACSTSSISYVEDSTAPAAPTGLATTPASPANDNSPKVTGSAEAGSTVQLYGGFSCTGGLLAEGPASSFASPGITISVADNSSTTIGAKSVDAAGNVSPCSSTVTYVEDSNPPAAPTITQTIPASPANDNDPEVKGTTGAGSPTQVKIYKSSDCSGTPTTGSVATFTGSGITVNVPADATTALSARTADAAGNESPCSNSITYTEDSTAPAPPTITDTDPDSPANDNNPEVKGSAEAGSTVKLYTGADCSGSPVTQGSAASFASPGLTATVAGDSTTTFRATATDAAGNVSACSGARDYVEDSTQPTNPALDSPSHDTGVVSNDPTVEVTFTGAADSGSGVDGFSYQWSTSSTTAPDTTKDAEESAGGTTSAALADGSSHWFHLRTVDNAGNWTTTVHLGPFVIDTTPPSQPTITSTVPASPANDNDPEVRGSGLAGTTIKIYAGGTCSGSPVASGSVATFNSTGLTVNVPDDSTTTLRATATDTAGNESPCGNAFTYTEDSTAPAAPTITDTDPDSPANDNNPEVKGSAEAGSTVKLYTGADCSGSPVAQGTAASFASPGITATVANDSTTTFRATATDAAGNTSDCSGSLTYVEDSTIPAAPSGLATTSASPANDNSPELSGTAEAGTTVKVYSGSTCSGAPLAEGSASAFGSPGLTIDVADDSTTTLTATATDATGNVSPCSDPITYVEDSTPPTQPTITSTVPASPANDNNPEVKGSGPGSTTIKIYTGGTCSGSPVATGSISEFNLTGLTVSVPDDSTTTFRATATDAAGNESPCGNAFTYTEDSTAPAPPTITDTDPDSPANDNDPEVSGTVGAGSSAEVRIYKNAACSAGADASGTVPAFTGAGITVGVADDSATTFRAATADAAGNVSPCSNSITYTEDSSAPQTTIDSGPSGPTSITTPTFTFSASEPGSSFACSLDGAGFGSCSGPGDAHTTAPLSEGGHSFAVRATDPAGNTDASAASRDFSVEGDQPGPDVTPPDLLLKAKKTQKVLKQKGVIVKAECANEGCTASAKGTVKGAGKLKLKGITRELGAGVVTKLKLKASAKVRRKLAGALEEGKKLRAKLTATAADAAGNQAQKQLKVKLR